MGRFTKPITPGELQAMSLGDYEAADGVTTQEIIDRLGEIEDMIDAGTLPSGDVFYGDTVYYIYKSAAIMECTVKKIQTTYSRNDNSYRFFVLLYDEFFEKEFLVPYTDYGTTWFSTSAEAETALAIFEAREGEDNGTDA